MNSVPKTVRDIPYGVELPFIIDQCIINGSVYNSLCIDWLDTQNRFTKAIFRVYPKGENPQSKLRDQKREAWINALKVC